MSNVKTRPLMFQLNWDPDIKGVILLGAFGNLPWKSRNILVQNEENFQALIDASMKALRNGTLGEYLPVKMRAIAGPGNADHRPGSPDHWPAFSNLSLGADERR